MPLYFCHQCNQEKDSTGISVSSAAITCNGCGSEFVEEVTNDNRQEFSTGGSGEFFGGLNRHHPLLFHPLLGHRVATATAAGGGGGGGPDARHAEAFGPLPIFRFGIDGVLGMLESGGPLDQMMQQLLSQIDRAGGGGGAPPATREELARVKSTTIGEDQAAAGAQCFVCLDEFKAGDKAERLPCLHHFHPQCIRPWLEKRGNCPVCRKSLSAEPEDAEGAAATATATATVEADGPLLGATGYDRSRQRPAQQQQQQQQQPAQSEQPPPPPRSRGGFLEDDCD